ncbi:hypothetical protein [Methanosarcina horonobensis]|uniref:hypothetical protein n=1 Tax=Methanosarcina horonobensis TaxID=418008 RepID=UPI000A90717B|nr:hypothetical protein [Methanosarcina horonobensis]
MEKEGELKEDLMKERTRNEFGKPTVVQSKLGEATVSETEVSGIKDLTPVEKKTPAVTAFQGQSKRQLCRSLGNC